MRIKTRVEFACIPVSRRSSRAGVASEKPAIASVPLSLMADDGWGNASAEASTAVRSFHINIPKEALVDFRHRIAETRWPEKETGTEGATRDDAGVGALLSNGLRLAELRGETQRPTAIRDRDPWVRHSFDPGRLSPAQVSGVAALGLSLNK